jgi:hypothetical protein
MKPAKRKKTGETKPLRPAMTETDHRTWSALGQEIVLTATVIDRNGPKSGRVLP